MKLNFLLLFVIAISTFSQAQNVKKFIIPRYFIGGAEAYIFGPFDGDAANTTILFENNRTESFNIKPLIESKDKILIKVPPTNGAFELILIEEGNDCDLFTPVRLIQFKMEHENKVYYPGEIYDLTVKLQGAEKMDESFNFTLKNMSPDIVSLKEGFTQKAVIKSSLKDKEVVWKDQLKILAKGQFILKGLLEQPVPTLEFPIKE